MRKFATVADLQADVGKEIAVSDWMMISQERVNQFAEATDDPQWIHVDVERAKRESPFGGTIAHGYMTLSLIPALFEAVVDLPPGKMSINYGLNKVRFPSPMLVGGRLRGRFKLLAVEPMDGCVQSIWQMTIEREGSDKPVCVAESVLRKYF
ncbi:MAG: MaoC family dehydratase [Burkholderiaceae bacterium]|jgi:acyl dehydratase|nr:MaoC family dehydratase [Polynucleobacter sp.]